jgi:hypothetical protein
MIVFLPLSFVFVVLFIRLAAREYLAGQQRRQRERELGARPGWTNRCS